VDGMWGGGQTEGKWLSLQRLARYEILRRASDLTGSSHNISNLRLGPNDELLSTWQSK
jgi:hypothetical protein